MKIKGYIVMEFGEPMRSFETDDILLVFLKRGWAKTYSVHPDDVRRATLIIEEPKRKGAKRG